jgi:hypothetical protein
MLLSCFFLLAHYLAEESAKALAGITALAKVQSTKVGGCTS